MTLDWAEVFLDAVRKMFCREPVQSDFTLWPGP